MTSFDKLLAIRPENALKRLGSKSKVCLLNSRDIFNSLAGERVIVMTANTRIKHVIPGIMRAAEEMDAVVGFELAKSECNLEGGYTGMDSEAFFNTAVEYADKRRFMHPFFIHGDHTTVRDTSEKEINSAKEHIEAGIKAGYTSFAIDASFNELKDNIQITAELAKPILEKGIGLEVEVGEIKPAGQEAELTTVEEAVEFIEGLKERGIHPKLLAINNGSKHGNYKPGEEVNIDLKRTGEVYNAVKKHGISMAQHGITGTPLNLVGQFADYGIRKGNVGTLWQNIAHGGLPKDLFKKMNEWAESNNKDIKFATKVFKKEIDSIPSESAKDIEEWAYREAIAFIKAFRAKGTASKMLEG